MEELDKLSAQLLKLETSRDWQVADETCKVIASIFGIDTERFRLWHDPRIVAEATRFMTAFETVNNPAAYEARHSTEKEVEIKLYWMKKSSKTNLSWIAGAADNFEDSATMQHKKVGIDLVVPEACDKVYVIVSNQYKLRVLELHRRLSVTDREILTNVLKIRENNVLSIAEKSAYHTVIWDAFNFEPINRKFYIELVGHFIVLVDHLEGSLKRKPSVMFTTRLIGRLLFIWFLKKKNLVNLSIDYFSAPNSERQKEYYEKKLEKLFFEVLNTSSLERGNSDTITPYLNGGLFDKSSTDFYDDPRLTFPDGYFYQLFNTLNKYNFTVDESSPEFQHVAIDPEMLGRIFESLLAEQIDENTGNTKKKATGAFYTPREIVSYMCEQALIEYLKTEVSETPDRDRRIEELVRMPEAIFRDQDQNKRRDWKPYREAIIRALEGSKTQSPITVLDPAVGSGAFPMGMLHLLVKVYSRLDSKFEKDISGLKRDILSRSLYGVDIEQTAIEITRLRAWLSIIVDIPEGEKVEPLPNLEFKFVCANALIPLDSSEQATLFTDHDLKDKLITIRNDYFRTSSKIKKEKLQKDYLKLTQNTSLFDNKKTQQLKSYRPFDVSASSEFYDPELMHGVQAFDVVIGNPPYVRQESIKNKSELQKEYEIFNSVSDLYTYFYEKGTHLLNKRGVLAFITSNKFMRARYGVFLRKYLQSNLTIKNIINFGDKHVFEAITNTLIFLAINEKPDKNILYFSDSITEPQNVEFVQQRLQESEWTIERPEVIKLKDKIEKMGEALKRWQLKINYGIKTGFNEAFVVSDSVRRELVKNDTRSKEILKPIIRGRDIGRYSYRDSGLFIINSHNGYKLEDGSSVEAINIDEYPAIKSHLMKYQKELEKRKDKGNTIYNLRDCAFIQDFAKEKIIWIELASVNKFSYSIKEDFLLAGAFIMTGESLKYLLAFLNSKLCLFYFSLICNSSGMDTMQWKKFAVEKIPVKKISSNLQGPFVALVDEILTLKAQNKAADTKNLESQIDQLVYKLYDLTPEEIEIVENSNK